MIKQLLIIIIVSVLAIFFSSDLVNFLHFVASVESFIIEKMHSLLPKSQVFYFLENLIIIIVFPLIISMIISQIFNWIMPHKKYFKKINKDTWLILLLVFILCRM